jgi:hypothetical protein
MMPFTPASHSRRARAGSFTVHTCAVRPSDRITRANWRTGTGSPRWKRGTHIDW